MIKPVSLACGHSGCMKCLHSIVSLADNATSNTAPFPVSRKTFHRDQLHLNVSLSALARNLAVYIVPILVAYGKALWNMHGTMARAVPKLSSNVLM